MGIMIKQSRVAVRDRTSGKQAEHSLPTTKGADDIRHHKRTHTGGNREADGHENRLDLGIRKSQCGEGDCGIDGTRRAQ